MTRRVEPEPPVIVWGRCRPSGSRWFWAAHIVGGEDRYGWAPSRTEAAQKANRAAVLLAAGQYATIRIDDTVAEVKFAAVTAEKKAKTKADNAQRAANGQAVNLFAVEFGYYDHGARRWVPSQIVRLPVIKTTAKRIFFLLSTEPGEFERGSIDRQAFEAKGWVYSSRFRKVYAVPPELPKDRPFVPPPYTPDYDVPRVTVTVEELKRLKAVMRAAHPDLGGTDEAFIKARAEYERARNLTHHR